jgi:hypothetical protein
MWRVAKPMLPPLPLPLLPVRICSQPFCATNRTSITISDAWLKI